MWQRTSDEPEMSLEQWMKFIDMVEGRGIRNVEMFGGDALLRKDVLLPLTRYIRSKGIPEVDLVTNCTLMDCRTAHELADAGISTVYISMDGVDDVQDTVRGQEGSYLKVEHAVEYLKEARGSSGFPRIALNCTVSRFNSCGLHKIVDFADTHGVDSLAFEYAGEFPAQCLDVSAVNGIAPQPYFVSQGESILLNRQQAIALKQALRGIKKGKKHYKFSLITKNIDALRIENLVKGEFRNSKCYICRYLVTVDPFGNILPCAFFNDYHLGNVRTEHFNEIWKNEAHRRFMRAVDREKKQICMYCVVGVERNPTFMQEIGKAYFKLTNTGYDEKIAA